MWLLNGRSGTVEKILNYHRESLVRIEKHVYARPRKSVMGKEHYKTEADYLEGLR